MTEEDLQEMNADLARARIVLRLLIEWMVQSANSPLSGLEALKLLGRLDGPEA